MMNYSQEAALYYIREADDKTLSIEERRKKIIKETRHKEPATYYKNWCKAKRRYFMEHGLATEAELKKWRKLGRKPSPEGQFLMFGDDE